MSDQSTSDDAISVASSPPPEAAKPSSRWEDFVDIFYTPSDVFARRRTSGFGIPMLVVTVLIGGIFLANSSAMQPIMDAEFTRQTAAMMRQNPGLTPEMMEKGRSIGETFQKIGAFIFLPIAMFLTGLSVWLVGKLFDATQGLGAAIMVASYSYVVRVVESAVGGLQLLLMDPASLNGRLKISLGVGRFLDPDATSPILLALLGRVDVFTIWLTILLGIGLSVTGKIPRAKAMIAAVIVWFVGAIPLVLGALRQ